MIGSETGTARPHLLRRAGRLLAHYARLILGVGFILLGIAGVILPVLPGTIWLIIGTLLIGKRSRLLRRVAVGGKLLLRRWAATERPVAGAIGHWALRTQRDSSRQLRHAVWWCQARFARPRDRAA